MKYFVIFMLVLMSLHLIFAKGNHGGGGGQPGGQENNNQGHNGGQHQQNQANSQQQTSSSSTKKESSSSSQKQSSNQQQSSSSNQNQQTSAATSSSSVAESTCNSLNKFRTDHGIPALTPDKELNKNAQKCADYYVEKKDADYSCPYTNGAGEIAHSTKGNFSPADFSKLATQNWYDQGKDYDYGKPTYSKSCKDFTQMLER